MSDDDLTDRITDDQHLDNNIVLRHDIVKALITDSDGKQNLRLDKDTVLSVRGLLKDNDSSIYTKRRLNVDELGAENNKRAAELIENILKERTTGTRDNTSKMTRNGPVVDASKMPKFEITPGALSNVGNTVDLTAIQAEGRSVRKGQDSEE